MWLGGPPTQMINFKMVTRVICSQLFTYANYLEQHLFTSIYARGAKIRCEMVCKHNLLLAKIFTLVWV